MGKQQHAHQHHEQNHDNVNNHSTHDHPHDPGHHHDPGNKAGLMIAFIITTGIMLLEFSGGLLTGSLALLSDSGHMLSDSGALALSLLAMWLAAKPASSNRSYGFLRFEILAALLNGVSLFVIAGFIIREAYQRFLEPPVVQSGSMMLIAFIGLIANMLSAWFLMRKGDVKDNINIRSAYLHILSDAIGSVGAIIAGLLMLLFSWYVADPIISVIVALLILKSAWGVVRWTVHILMEGTPIAIDPGKVKQTLLKIQGVKDVHDLHIWTITSGHDSLTCHFVVDEQADSQEILQSAIKRIEETFRISHITIQIETSSFQHTSCD
ncbi:cobalt-zinc-cadmium efflux system protein [Paenibacillus sophorae]|uniref:Cation diffusion facilitator family transporter n=1 Tax=Paenibacillus sophorae TaxID=1333845 RepID=A0A1H8F815_9BACL|nr:cation diffusion facilitator family transporter [Paenibacillus sophorae]QWU13789.1 cation diffusion facilitator family transporter [Paenibacillus sophorae]SEN27822.1 cobalt-zinc-cadmium efflux system protein [Paenibacillus sophorae]